MNLGGKRPGAGRKKGFKFKRTMQLDEARQYIIDRVTSELRPILDKAIEQAKQGDTSARKELMDRAFGRPTESVKVEGDIILKIDI